MRLPTALTSGVSAAAALLLLTACGGDAEESSASSSSGENSAATQTSSAAAGSESDADPQTFCTQAIDAGSDLDAAFSAAGTDAAQLPTLLQQMIDRFESLNPPAAVTDDMSELIASLDRLSDAADGIDFAGDPNAFTTFQQYLSQEEGAFTEAENGITDYIRTECGIDPATGETLTS